MPQNRTYEQYDYVNLSLSILFEQDTWQKVLLYFLGKYHKKNVKVECENYGMLLDVKRFQKSLII